MNQTGVSRVVAPMHPTTEPNRATVRCGILGATGYTALELIKLLLRHSGAKITAVTSRQEGRPAISSVHPSLTGRLDLHL